MQGRSSRSPPGRFPGMPRSCSTTYRRTPDDVREGDEILIDDGRITLKAVKITSTDVVCKVPRGRTDQQQQGHQPARSRGPGVGAVGQGRRGPAMGPRRGRGHRGAVVRPAPGGHRRRPQVMDEEGAQAHPRKIEKPQAVDHLTAIIEAFDGIMVARGDPAWSCPSSRCRWCRSAPSVVAGRRQTRHRRHPDALTAWSPPVGRPGGSSGRRGTRCSTGGRVDAQPGDQRRRPSRTRRRDDGQDHRVRRGEGARHRLGVAGQPHRVHRAGDHRAACEVAEEVDAKFIISFTETGLTHGSWPGTDPGSRRCASPRPSTYATSWRWCGASRRTPAEGHPHHRRTGRTPSTCGSRRCPGRAGDKVITIAGVPPGSRDDQRMRVHTVVRRRAMGRPRRHTRSEGADGLPAPQTVVSWRAVASRGAAANRDAHLGGVSCFGA